MERDSIEQLQIQFQDQLRDQLQSQPTLHAKAQVLIQQLESMGPTIPQPMLAIADALLAEAWIARDRAAIPPLLRCKAMLHTQLVQFHEGSEAYTDLLRYARETDNKEAQVLAIQGLGMVHRLQGETLRAIDYFLQGLELSRAIGLIRGVAANSNSLGICYSIIGEFGKALEAYLQSLQVYRTSNNQRGIGIALHNIASMYVNIGDYDNALKHYQEQLVIEPAHTNPSSTAKALQSMARIYLKQGQYEEAMRAATESLQVFTMLQDTMGEAKAIGTLGIVNRAIGRNEVAFSQFEQAKEMARQIGDPETYVDTLHHLGTLLLEMGEIAQARGQLERAERAARRHNFQDVLLAICGHLADACGQQEDFPSAYRYRTEQAQLQQEIGSHQKQKALAELQMRYDVERAQQEREIYRLKSEQLQMVVEYKTNELSSIALSLIHKQELLESLSGRLRQVIQKFPAAEVPAQLGMLLEELIAESAADSGWTLFKETMRQTDQSFLRRLAERYPVLTPTELQVCALLKMEMASKDIANILGVSVRDVESHRYNLRKKLSLAPSESLSAFLNQEEFRAAENDRATLRDQEFTERLSQQYPSLSSKELKICTLLKAGLTTKEITQLLSVSDRTVENHRYHIRKKLNLPANSNLSTFFAAL